MAANSTNSLLSQVDRGGKALSLVQRVFNGQVIIVKLIKYHKCKINKIVFIVILLLLSNQQSKEVKKKKKLLLLSYK